MSLRKREPVKYTCPDIDKAISTIKSIVKQMKSCDIRDEKDVLLICINNWKEDLENVGVGNRCDLEYLRSANSSLREWGHDMYNEAESLEEERDLLEIECSELKEKVSELEDKIQKLESVTN